MKPEPTEPPRMGYNLPYPRQAEQDAYEARERAKLKDLWMPLADGSLKYDNYPSITQETGINYPDMYDAPPEVADPELYSEILPAPKKDWKGGMRKHSRTSDYREPYVVGGLASALRKTIPKATTEKGKTLRRRFLNKNYLKGLKPTKRAVKSSQFNLSAEDVFDLLQDGRVSVNEARFLLQDGGFKKQTIKINNNN